MKIVIFDTSLLRAKKREDMKKKFPRSSWDWAITETTDLELGDMNTLEIEEQKTRKNLLKKLAEMKIKVLFTRGKLLNLEIEKCRGIKFPSSFPFYNDEVQKTRWEMLKKMVKGEKNDKFDERIRRMQEGERKFWLNLPENNGKTNITSEMITSKVENIMCLDTKLSIDGKSLGKVIQELGLEKIITECPGLMMTIHILGFIQLVGRPKDATKGFTIQLDHEKIKLDVNTLNDMAIAASVLPYVDTFATRDKYQAKIFEKLSPENKSKIHLESS